MAYNNQMGSFYIFMNIHIDSLNILERALPAESKGAANRWGWPLLNAIIAITTIATQKII
jgi:hypothetical protein